MRWLTGGLGGRRRRDQAFIEVFGVAESDLLNVAVRYCHDPHRAEQFVQDTFVRLLRMGDRLRLDVTGNPRAYARRVLLNILNDDYRRRTGRSESQDDAATTIEVVVDHATLSLLETRPIADHARLDEAIDLMRAFDQLQFEVQQVLDALYWAELTVAETATLLQISNSQVESRRHIGIAILRELLTEEEV